VRIDEAQASRAGVTDDSDSSSDAEGRGDADTRHERLAATFDPLEKVASRGRRARSLHQAS
jgi:hypothetical protein